jgi:CheY-like chemotaxis protein
VQAVALSSTAADTLPMTLDQGRKPLDFSPDPANPGATLAGFTLGLPPQPLIDVEVLPTTGGELVTGLSFELTSSATPQGSLGTLFGRFDVAPRGASGLTASDGHLRASADSGTYNLTVRFPESSGFPWLVKPRVALPLAESGSLRVSLPVEVNGTAFDLPLGGPRGNPLVGARIQAFALSGGTYVPVASTTVDARGSYRLLLPSRLLRLRSHGSPRIDSRFVPKDRPEQAPSAVETDLPGALHEVSNALTVVVGWLDRALSAPLDPELRRALIIAHARALDGRDIARSAIGARALSSVQQTMASLLDEAILGVLPEASSRGVHVTLRPLTGGPVLLDDARVLLQILTNLLLNAVAFSPADGTVEVTARTEQGDALIRVSDEGPGLPAERRANLFERGHSTRDGGAGVGLAHARDLAHQHGGELLLEESDRGASFSLRWPCAPTRSSASLIPRPSVALRGRRVLLVEDDGAIVELLDIALSARGAEVIAVSDASALSAALLQGPIDLVLLDWSPIAADARTHLAAVQAAFPGAPLVAISGSAALSDADVLSLCAAWVRKPFELTELLGAVAAALASRA